MKRFITVLIILLTVLLALTGTVLAADGYPGEVSPYAVLLIDANSGTVLSEKNADQQIEPASTTKIMTLLLALEKGNMSDTVTVSANAADQSGSTLEPKLRTGEEVNFEDLINGMMMASGNDAAVAVAEHIGGSEEGFAAMMNTKATQLGMKNTHFIVPHGMHTEGHVTTARDMALLTMAAMKNPQFVQIVKQTSYTMPATNKSNSRVVKNTNKLLQSDSSSYYQYATGIKTGSTPAAGDCLVASASKNGMDLICLIFQDKYNGSERWPLAKSLFEWGFDNFTTVDMQTLLDKIEPLQIQIENYASTDESDGLLQFEGPTSAGTFTTIEKSVAEGILNGTDKIVPETSYTSSLQAPVVKGDVLGTVTYRSEATDEIIYQGSLIATRDVLQAGAEPNASGGTAVNVMPAVNIEEITKPDNNVFYWLIIPVGLIVFLVVRLLTVTRRKRKRFNKRRPHYSYRIK